MKFFFHSLIFKTCLINGPMHPFNQNIRFRNDTFPAFETLFLWYQCITYNWKHSLYLYYYLLFPPNVLFPHPWYIIYGILISIICFFNSRYFALLMWHSTLWWISQKQPPMVFTSIFVPFNQYIKCNMNIVPSRCYIQQGRSLSVKLFVDLSKVNRASSGSRTFKGGANPKGGINLLVG